MPSMLIFYSSPLLYILHPHRTCSRPASQAQHYSDEIRTATFQGFRTGCEACVFVFYRTVSMTNV